jgi:hypothetical protein
MQRYFNILGHKVRDKITGYEGIAESLAFDLYGCVQIAVRPMLAKGAKPGEYPDGRWFDFARFEIISKTPVMDVPTFADKEHGPADKPNFTR